MIARYGEFVTRCVKTEKAITSATVQKAISWSMSDIAKPILPVSKRRTLVSLNTILVTNILLPEQMTKEIIAFIQMEGLIITNQEWCLLLEE